MGSERDNTAPIRCASHVRRDRPWEARDRQRDPRFALHSGSDDPPAWEGDAKLAGVAEEVPHDGHHRFRLDLREVSTVSVDRAANELVVTVWTPRDGVRTIRRPG